MQFKPITVIVVLLLVVASLLVSGCTSNTPSPTSTPLPTYTASSPTPMASSSSDFSSYFNKMYSGGTAMIKQQFTKGTSAGNTVYKGVTKNSSSTGSYQYTVVITLTQSQSAAKKLYDQTVAQRLSEGFTAKPLFCELRIFPI